MRHFAKNPFLYAVIVLAALLPFQNCGMSAVKNAASNQEASNDNSTSWYSNLSYEVDAAGVYTDCGSPTAVDLNNDSVETKMSWGSATDLDSYLLVDLGENVSVNRVRVGGRGPSECWGLPARYWNSDSAAIEIQVSLDKLTWRTVAHGDQIAYFNTLLSDISFATETARYVRIFKAEGWLATGTFRVGYSSLPLPPPRTPYPQPLGTDHWYSGMTYSTSDIAPYEGCAAPTEANMNDNIAENKDSWGSESAGEASFIQVDLGSVKSVNEILVGGWAPCWDSAAEYWPGQGVLIQVSLDGQTWKTVADGSAIVYSDTELKPIYFATQNARYVRLFSEEYVSTGQFRIGLRQ